MSDIIENRFLETVRNFSLPWHDPAISPNTDYGKNFLDNQLRSQIVPSTFVLLIDNLFRVESNLKWLMVSIDYAVQLEKEIVLVNGCANILKVKPELQSSKMDFEIENFEPWLQNLLDNGSSL